jgi:hypothetical protein
MSHLHQLTIHDSISSLFEKSEVTTSSYQPLADHLATRKDDVWEASFVDIQYILGRSLPRSAFVHPAWWANQTGPGHSQTRAWKSVGWKTSKLDLERRRVTFERDRTRSGEAFRDAGDVQPGQLHDPNADLIARAMAISGIGDREEVVAAALKSFIRQEAVRFVDELGGSAPDFQAAPRERPWS